MTPLLIAALGLLMVATAFLSGLFGMAGGMILIGVLLDHPAAALGDGAARDHADGVERLARLSVARHIRWRPVAIYLIGCALALGAWSITRYVPDKPIALLLLGITPFMARLMPKSLKPNPTASRRAASTASSAWG